MGTDLGQNSNSVQNSLNKGAFEELKVLEGNFVELDQDPAQTLETNKPKDLLAN